MASKKSIVAKMSVLSIVFTLAVFIGISGNMSIAQGDEVPDLCGDNEDFTTDFLTDRCRFRASGYNPYFILFPGFQSVLETPEGEEEREKAVVTVLRKTKKIRFDGRRINTRVVEERALEWEEGEGGEEGDWKTVEISLNWFAICNKTNDVFYFGEWSRDCPDGFDENDVCEGGESTAGSWEAGVDGAQPGIMMPGTFLLGAKYFQEVAPPDAVDRGQHVAMGEDVEVPAGNFEDCVVVIDTNPNAGECCPEFPDGEWEDACDVKIYCSGIGLVQDQDLELVSFGFLKRDKADKK